MCWEMLSRSQGDGQKALPRHLRGNAIKAEKVTATVCLDSRDRYFLFNAQPLHFFPQSFLLIFTFSPLMLFLHPVAFG